MWNWPKGATVFTLKRPDGSRPCAVCVAKAIDPPKGGDIYCDSCGLLCCPDHSFNVRRQQDGSIKDCLCYVCAPARSALPGYYPYPVYYVSRAAAGQQAGNAG